MVLKSAHMHQFREEVFVKIVTLHFMIKDMVHSKRYGSMDPWIHGYAARATAGAAASAATVCTYYKTIGGMLRAPL